jgi:hypothetical protein
MKKLILTTLLLAGCSSPAGQVTTVAQTPLNVFIREYDTQTELLKSKCDLNFGEVDLRLVYDNNGTRATIDTRCILKYEVIGITKIDSHSFYLVSVKSTKELILTDRKSVLNKDGKLIPVKDYFNR